VRLEVVGNRRSATPVTASDASFELLARRMLGKMLQYFDVSQFDMNVEQRVNAIGECG
jgi:hypothetical protein